MEVHVWLMREWIAGLGHQSYTCPPPVGLDSRGKRAQQDPAPRPSQKQAGSFGAGARRASSFRHFE